MTEVTIGIAAYNAENTLERAIDSALGQSFGGRYEIVVADDGSTDLTPNIARSYALQFPDIVRFFRFENRGVATTRNSILKRARGTYMTWLDADDYYFPNKIDVQYRSVTSQEKLSNEKISVFSNFLMGHETYDFSQYEGDAVAAILRGELRAYLWSSMMRTSHYRALNGFTESLHRSEDQDLLIRFLLSGGKLHAIGGDAAMVYHFSTMRPGRHVEASLDFIVEKYGDLMKSLGIYDEYVPRRYWEIAGFYRANKDWDDMWRCRGMAVKLDHERYFPRLMATIFQEVDGRVRTIMDATLRKTG
ncbi:glycosyltransferase family A protein [Roseomonas sp. USHLN139]|uniref:glycosyltransferase family A protein n=1 Tax=Roseomonas sp. USHLN139 TaxID=3081298 RepID=UPI003B0233D5